MMSTKLMKPMKGKVRSQVAALLAKPENPNLQAVDIQGKLDNQEESQRDPNLPRHLAPKHNSYFNLSNPCTS